jgi:hypothetical protein
MGTVHFVEWNTFRHLVRPCSIAAFARFRRCQRDTKGKPSIREMKTLVALRAFLFHSAEFFQFLYR